ncbi:MAG: PKD domain-containing protein [Candidatus Sumerlaeota bacterium]|nr:PKD domain-containing protein [Candidatus Sumerlaeota bacterium]
MRRTRFIVAILACAALLMPLAALAQRPTAPGAKSTPAGKAVPAAAAGASASAAPATGAPSQWKARREIKVMGSKGGLATAAYARFWTMNLARENGSDIFIMDKRNQPVKFKIMVHAPGVPTIVAFDPTGRDPTLYAYFGGAAAPTQTDKWEPQCGLFLETRKLEGPFPHQINLIQQIIARHTMSYGGGFRSQIYDGINPFGSSDGFISIYTGWFNQAQPEIYQIATASNDSSFVLIDGNMVVSCPERNAADRGRHGLFINSVKIEKGLHKLEYLHACVGAAPVMMLAWVKPGTARDLQPVPENFFTPIVAAAAGPLELSDGLCNADFFYAVYQSLRLYDPPVNYIEGKFALANEPSPSEVKQIAWDFGDGVVSKENATAINHTFIGPGRYRIKTAIELKSGKTSMAEQTILVTDRDDVAIELAPAKIKTVAKTLATYPFEVMDPDKVRGALPLLRDESLWKDYVRAGDALMKSPKYQNDIDCVRSQYEAIRDGLQQKDKARQFLQETIARADGKKDLLCQVLYLLAEFDRRWAHDALLALQSIKKIEADKQAAIGVKRFAWQLAVLKGDCYRALADYDKALASYREAEKIEPRGGATAALRRSSFGLTVESYLDSKEYDAAQDMLVRWEEEFPTEKLYGLSSFLWAKYYLKTNQREEAVLTLETLHKVNPGSSLNRGVTDMLADLLMQDKKWDKALEALRSLKGHYDDPRFDRSVQDRIEQCEKQKRS